MRLRHVCLTGHSLNHNSPADALYRSRVYNAPSMNSVNTNSISSAPVRTPLSYLCLNIQWMRVRESSGAFGDVWSELVVRREVGELFPSFIEAGLWLEPLQDAGVGMHSPQERRRSRRGIRSGISRWEKRGQSEKTDVVHVLRCIDEGRARPAPRAKLPFVCPLHSCASFAFLHQSLSHLYTVYILPLHCSATPCSIPSLLLQTFIGNCRRCSEFFAQNWDFYQKSSSSPLHPIIYPESAKDVFPIKRHF